MMQFYNGSAGKSRAGGYLGCSGCNKTVGEKNQRGGEDLLLRMHFMAL
jgi:hypothetical protein